MGSRDRSRVKVEVYEARPHRSSPSSTNPSSSPSRLPPPRCIGGVANTSTCSSPSLSLTSSRAATMLHRRRTLCCTCASSSATTASLDARSMPLPCVGTRARPRRPPARFSEFGFFPFISQAQRPWLRHSCRYRLCSAVLANKRTNRNQVHGVHLQSSHPKPWPWDKGSDDFHSMACCTQTHTNAHTNPHQQSAGSGGGLLMEMDGAVSASESWRVAKPLRTCATWSRMTASTPSARCSLTFATSLLSSPHVSSSSPFKMASSVKKVSARGGRQRIVNHFPKPEDLTTCTSSGESRKGREKPTMPSAPLLLAQRMAARSDRHRGSCRLS